MRAVWQPHQRSIHDDTQTISLLSLITEPPPSLNENSRQIAISQWKTQSSTRHDVPAIHPHYHSRWEIERSAHVFDWLDNFFLITLHNASSQRHSPGAIEFGGKLAASKHPRSTSSIAASTFNPFDCSFFPRFHFGLFFFFFFSPNEIIKIHAINLWCDLVFRSTVLELGGCRVMHQIVSAVFFLSNESIFSNIQQFRYSVDWVWRMHGVSGWFASR